MRTLSPFGHRTSFDMLSPVPSNSRVAACSILQCVLDQGQPGAMSIGDLRDVLSLMRKSPPTADCCRVLFVALQRLLCVLPRVAGW